MNKAKWIWFYGDFELYHNMLLMSRRISYEGYHKPMWEIASPVTNFLTVTKTAYIAKEETFSCTTNAELKHIKVSDGVWNEQKGVYILAPGEHTITVSVFKRSGFPAIYCEGDTFASDESWTCLYAKKKLPVGTSSLYTNKNDNPEVFKFAYERIYPVSSKVVDGGILYDFGKETCGKLVLEDIDPSVKNIDIVTGESPEEALDSVNAIICLHISVENGTYVSENAIAFRYIYIPGNVSLKLSADYEYLPLENKGSFRCNDEQINKIWDIASYTMHLNTREGYFDGIQRDRWIWSGDAYQSYMVNYYLTNDNESVKRTLLMLRGRDPIVEHINTIVDYSFYWIMGIWEYYFYSGDKTFVECVYGKMLTMMDYIMQRLDENGLYVVRERDWMFIDWSDFDKQSGPLSAEQILLAKAYEYMANCAALLDKKDDEKKFRALSADVLEKVLALYWDEEKGAFIDDYKTGNRNVTRHANIFALLYNVVDEAKCEKIIKNVIKNKDVQAITTPYFEYFELDAMCRIGEFKYMTDMLYSYWGGMLKLGATTFWEQFDPNESGLEHYAMYGEKFGRSLCHAWSSSPIYLLGRYALGVEPTSPGYKTFTVKPNLMCFKNIEGNVPTPFGTVYVKMDENKILVRADAEGGVLTVGSNEYSIPANEEIIVNIE